jgi:hypothetical protein
VAMISAKLNRALRITVTPGAHRLGDDQTRKPARRSVQVSPLWGENAGRNDMPGICGLEQAERALHTLPAAWCASRAEDAWKAVSAAERRTGGTGGTRPREKGTPGALRFNRQMARLELQQLARMIRYVFVAQRGDHGDRAGGQPSHRTRSFSSVTEFTG